MTDELEKLRILYADGNKLSASCVEELCKNKHSLVYLSVRNNGIGGQISGKIELAMAEKGGYLEYWTHNIIYIFFYSLKMNNHYPGSSTPSHPSIDDW